MNARIEQLIKALRSGEYTQIKGTYKDGDCYCVLGVASDLAIRNGCNELNWQGDELHGKRLLSTIVGWYGFKSSYSLNVLANLNDKGCTFIELADYIEGSYEDTI